MCCPWARRGNATVFVREEALAVSGTESSEDINNDAALLEKVEAIRCTVAVRMGLAGTVAEARARPGTPKLVYVNSAREYKNSQGESVKVNEMDIYARVFSMGKLHHAYTGTGAIATAVAARIPGTIVQECISSQPGDDRTLRIGHAAGTLECDAVVYHNNRGWITEKAGLVHTARTLSRGEALVQGYLHHSKIP